MQLTIADAGGYPLENEYCQHRLNATTYYKSHAHSFKKVCSYKLFNIDGVTEFHPLTGKVLTLAVKINS